MLLLLHTANGFLRTSTSQHWARCSAIGAKKKGQRRARKAKQQKKSGMDWARDFEVMPYDSSALRPLASDAAGAFEARTGKPLDASLAGAGDLPKALYKAPVCVMVVAGRVRLPTPTTPRANSRAKSTPS